jgi:hypothetical protein
MVQVIEHVLSTEFNPQYCQKKKKKVHSIFIARGLVK